MSFAAVTVNFINHPLLPLLLLWSHPTQYAVQIIEIIATLLHPIRILQRFRLPNVTCCYPISLRTNRLHSNSLLKKSATRTSGPLKPGFG